MNIDFSKLEIKETKDERLERLKEQRKVAMEKCRYIANSARGNRTTNATRNIGTLTMIFGGATSIGLLVFKDPSLSTLFGAIALVGAAVYGNRRLHTNTTLKMNMHKQMVKIADERHDELATMNLETTDIDHIPMPKYEDYQKQARQHVEDNKKEILGKANFKIMQGTIKAFALTAITSGGLNYTEKNDLTNVEDYIVSKIESAKQQFFSDAPKTSIRPRARP